MYLLETEFMRDSTCLWTMIDVTDCQLIGKVDSAPSIHIINERELIMRLHGKDLVRQLWLAYSESGVVKHKLSIDPSQHQDT